MHMRWLLAHAPMLCASAGALYFAIHLDNAEYLILFAPIAAFLIPGDDND